MSRTREKTAKQAAEDAHGPSHGDGVTNHVHAAARVSPHAPAGGLRRAEPCVMVIFGAGGDLTRRKLMPSLFHLMGDGLLADTFHIVGVGREGPDHESFRETVRGALEKIPLSEMVGSPHPPLISLGPASPRGETAPAGEEGRALHAGAGRCAMERS